MHTPKDKLFVAAAKRLGALTDEQLRECLRLALERRKLGLEKELGDVALDKGYLTPERLKAILGFMAKAHVVRKSDSEASDPMLTPAPRPSGVAAAAPPPARVSGEHDLIDGYVIGDRLGEGGMATVFRARHKVLDKAVALKILSLEFSRSADYVARFLREARAAARIEHPNVVRIHDAGESRGRHYIAMELIEGQNLQKIVERDGPLSEIAALEVALGVAHALEAASQERIVHRDVKPANIARTPDGRVKLLDLGLARAQHRRGDDGYITDHGRTLGTPYFVSPEQARGEDLDSRSDIYSLGITLFFLLTGEHPFTGASAAEVMRRHIQDPVPSIRVLRPTLSPEADVLLQKMLAKDVKRRYQTPRDLAAALELMISGEAGGRAAPADDSREDREAVEERAARAKEAAKEEKKERSAAAKAERKAARAVAGGAAPAPIVPREVARPRTTVERLAFACAGMGGLLAVLIAIHWSLGRPAADAAARPRSEVEAAPRQHAAAARNDVIPQDFYLAKVRADEDANGGKPQDALAYWRKMFPPSKRVPGALKDALEAEERTIASAADARFAGDLERATKNRREEHYAIAKRIYIRIRDYGSIDQKARADQELATLDQEEAAAGAARASGGGDTAAKDRATFAMMLGEIAPLVRAGAYDKASARARELAGNMNDAVMIDGAKDAARHVAELTLLDAAAEKAIAATAGVALDDPPTFGLTTGQTLVGQVVKVEPGGHVAVASSSGRSEFNVAQLAPAEKARWAILARGKTPDVERLLAIHELYRGEPAAAFERASQLGTPALLEHVRFVAEIALPGGLQPKGDVVASAAAPAGTPDDEKAPASAEPVSPPAATPPVKPPTAPGAPVAPPAAPKPTPPVAPPAPEGSKFERVFAGLLKAPVTCEKDSSFTAEYAWLPGSEETIKDWTVQKLPFKSGMTAKGYELVCRGRAAAKLVYKVPLAQPYELELALHFELVSAETAFLVTLSEGHGGDDFAIDCGQNLYRRSRGQVVQLLKKAPQPPGSYCKARTDIPLKISVANNEVTVEFDGRKTIDKCKIKEGDGLVGFEIAECQVALKGLKIRAQPEPMWYLEQQKKLPE